MSQIEENPIHTEGARLLCFATPDLAGDMAILLPRKLSVHTTYE